MYIASFLFTSCVLVSHAYDQLPPRIVKKSQLDETLSKVKQKRYDHKSYTIECEPGGYSGIKPPLRFRWMKDGKYFDWQKDARISQQPGKGKLVLTSPRYEDLGHYQCFFENKWSVATSDQVSARKAELNPFKDQFGQNVTAEENKPFKLSCDHPYGWPELRVHWFLQDNDGSIKSIDNPSIIGDSVGNLWFSNVTLSDNFAYICAIGSNFPDQYYLSNRFILNVQSKEISTS